MVNIIGHFKGYELKTGTRPVVVAHVNLGGNRPNLQVTFFGEEAEAAADLLDRLPENSLVEIFGQLRFREYNNKYYTDIRASMIIPLADAQATPSATARVLASVKESVPYEGKTKPFFRYTFATQSGGQLNAIYDQVLDPEQLYDLHMTIRTREYNGKTYTDFAVNKAKPVGITIASVEEEVPF